jgi:hypothetical protein
MIHRSLGLRLACAVAFAGALGGVDDAQACLTTTCAVKEPPADCVRDRETRCWLAGAPLQWKEACVSFSVDASGIPPLDLAYEDTEALVVSSFALWTAASCPDGFPTISVKSLAPLECTKREYNSEGPNSNGVIFRTDEWPYAREAIGITTVTFDSETGKLMDADIEVNVVGGGLDLGEVRYVIAHEAGHYFGIDHSADAAAVMYPQSPSSSFGDSVALTADDVNAICLAYPTTRAVGACDFEPERGFSPVCGGDIEGSCAVSRYSPKTSFGPDAFSFLTALAALLFRARKRRKGGANRLGSAGDSS